MGFFPSQCVEVISDKTDGQASLPSHTAPSHMTPGLFGRLYCVTLDGDTFLVIGFQYDK